MIARLIDLARALLAKLRPPSALPATVIPELPAGEEGIPRGWTPGDPGTPTYGRRQRGRRAGRG